jgi:hypothetical protein
MTLEDFQGQAVVEDNMIECFTVDVGLRRCDALSIILFNLLLDHIIKKWVSGKMYQLQLFKSMHKQTMWS